MRTHLLLLFVTGAVTLTAQPPSVEIRFRDSKTNALKSIGRARSLTFEAGEGVILAATPSQSADDFTINMTVDTAVITSVKRMQSGQPMRCMPSGGSGTSYRCAMLPPLDHYERGQPVIFFPDVSCMTDATLNIAGLGPRPLKKKASGRLVNIQSGDLVAGLPYLLISTDSEFVVLH